jgi:phage protein U
MGAVLLAWGDFQFEVGAAAYEELAHSAGARWEKQPIIGRRPAAQYLGPDEEVVTLRGTIYPDATGSSSATMIDDLLAAAQDSDVYTLMTADGAIVDVYRLEKARAVSTVIMPDGAKKMTFDLEFHVHDDGDTGTGSAWP